MSSNVVTDLLFLTESVQIPGRQTTLATQSDKSNLFTLTKNRAAKISLFSCFGPKPTDGKTESIV
jgi:hypothetical protein